MRLLTGAILFCTAILAEEALKPRMTPSAYEAHGRVTDAEVAADFLVHSIPVPQHPMLSSDYIVVEAAWYPAAGKRVMVNTARLSLRINGKKEPLLSQTPSAVAASIKYPNWRQHPELVAGAGVGDAGIVVGQLPRVSRFPGDNRRPPPRPTTAPKDPNIPDPEPVNVGALIQATALPDGQTSHPVSGFVYFPYTGRPKSIKAVELLVQTEGEPLVLKLR